MAKDTDKPAPQEPWPFGALAGKYPSIEIEDIKAARQEALLGIDQSESQRSDFSDVHWTTLQPRGGRRSDD